MISLISQKRSATLTIEDTLSTIYVKYYLLLLPKYFSVFCFNSFICHIENLRIFVIYFLWISHLTLRLSEHFWITLCTDFLYFDITWLLSIMSFSIVSIWATGLYIPCDLREHAVYDSLEDVKVEMILTPSCSQLVAMRHCSVFL